MPRYEYRVLPAPTKGTGGRKVKGTKMRFAHSLSAVMNEMGAAGWEFVRADTLPCEDRFGLFRKKAQNLPMLIFRRLRREDVSDLISVKHAVPPRSLPPNTGTEPQAEEEQPAEQDGQLPPFRRPMFTRPPDPSPPVEDLPHPESEPPLTSSDYDIPPTIEGDGYRGRAAESVLRASRDE